MCYLLSVVNWKPALRDRQAPKTKSDNDGRMISSRRVMDRRLLDHDTIMPATARAERRTSGTARRCLDQAQHRAVARRRRRRSGSTTAGDGTHRHGRTASSSGPTADTAPKRCGSPISGWLYAATASITVCQSQPRSAATSLTVRPCRPICTVAQRAAGSSTHTAPTRSAGPGRSTPVDTSGSASAGCATPTAPAGRTPASRPARPRVHRDDGRPRRSKSAGQAQSRSRSAASWATRRRRPRSWPAGRPAARTCA